MSSVKKRPLEDPVTDGPATKRVRVETPEECIDRFRVAITGCASKRKFKARASFIPRYENIKHV